MKEVKHILIRDSMKEVIFFSLLEGDLSQTLHEDNDNLIYLPTVTAMTHDSS